MKMDAFPDTNEETMIGHSSADQYHSLLIPDHESIGPLLPAYPWKNPSSATVCPRCQELELDVLLEKYSLFRARTVFVRNSLGEEDSRSMTQGILRTRASDICQDHQGWQECALAITQRVMLDGKSSLDTTCPICSRLEDSEWRFKLYPVCHLGKEALRYPTSGHEAVHPLKFEIGVPNGSNISGDKCCAAEKYGRPIKQVGNSVDYALVASWLKQCQMEHPTCTTSRRFSPDKLKRVRLLDVYKRALVVYTPDKKFIALSYLWGGKEQPLVPANGPVPRKLPLTIEHAMLVVQNLDYQYLWIDSVCIDQSDPVDKAAQIGNMDAVYSAACITIILLDSPHADFGIPGVSPDEGRGLFPSRQPVACFSSPRKDNRSGMTTLTVYGNHPTLYQEQLRSEWSKRAWTFQEALLSYRRIFFSKNQVFFSCAGMNRSEDHHAEFKQPAIDGFAEWGKRPLETLLYYNNRHDAMDCFDHYAYMIGNYVSRQMSDQSDGLRAISGVLSVWEAKLSCEKFVYGLPGWAFRMGLLWYNGDARDSQIIRRESTSLPSWSWCGWQWSDKQCVYFPLRFLDANLLPPLFISHDGNILVSNCGDSQDREEPDLSVEPAHVHEETTQKLFEDVTRRDGENRTRFQDQQVIINRPTLLTVRGILLRLPLEQEGTIDEYESQFPVFDYAIIDAKTHEFSGKHQANRHDCLLLNLNTKHDKIELKTILLLWENPDDDMMPKIARRAGVINWKSSVEDFPERWSILAPRWERFFLS